MTTHRFAPAYLGFQAFAFALLTTLAGAALISHGGAQAHEAAPASGKTAQASKAQPVYAGQLPRVEIRAKRLS